MTDRDERETAAVVAALAALKATDAVVPPPLARIIAHAEWRIREHRRARLAMMSRLLGALTVIAGIAVSVFGHRAFPLSFSGPLAPVVAIALAFIVSMVGSGDSAGRWSNG